MKITLIIEGKPKTFEQKFVSGRMLRRTIELDNEFEKLKKAASVTNEDGKVEYDESKYDKLKDLELASEYVAEAFNNQFSANEFIDGVEAHKLISEFLRVRTEVLTGRAIALSQGDDEKNE
jgi:hypothetical protein